VISSKVNPPESLVGHDCGEGAHVAAPEAPVVEEGEREVEDEGAPDGQVVPHRPVLRVQGNLQQLSNTCFCSL